MTSILDRLLAKTDRSSECWLWTASIRPDGYGQISVARRPRGARCVECDVRYRAAP